MWLLITSALGAPVDAHPWVAPVTLAPTGVQRLHVPTAMHDTSHPLRASNLVLLDRDGERVPFAVLEGTGRWERTLGSTSYAGDDDPVGIWPLTARNRFGIGIRARVQDRLRVKLPSSDYAVTAVLRDGDGTTLDRTLVWRMRGGEQHGTLKLPNRLGDYTLELLSDDGERLTPAVEGLREHLTWVPEEVVDLAITGTSVQSTGWARYDLDVGRAYPLEQVELAIADDLFEREVGVAVVDPHTLPGTLPDELYPTDVTTLRRLSIGGARVAQDTLSITTPPTRRLAVLAQSDENRPPLVIEGATGRFPGLHLVVRNPGPGPHQLYGGGRHIESSSDLQFAAAELERVAGDLVEPGDVTPNLDFVPPEARGDLGRPGRQADLRGQRFERAVTGPAGLVRIPLDDAVLEHARPDLADLRLVDGEGRQIPYVLRPDGLAHTWGELAFTVEQRGDATLLRVPIPHPNVALGTVTLTTPAPVFERRVRLARERGGRVETLRAYTWHGDGGPGALALALHQPVGDELLVFVDNGDDPALPIDSLRIDHPGWEMLAVLPATDGTRLVYGKAVAARPSYDFELLRGALAHRVQDVATVGPEAKLTATPLSMLDRLMLAGGVGVMALGLLGLTLILLRGTPAGSPDAPDETSVPPEPPPFGPDDDGPADVDLPEPDAVT